MIELDGSIHIVPDNEVGKRYTEAPWVHKRNGGGSFLRSVCIDYLYYNDDGSMKHVVQTTEGVSAAK